MLSHIDDRNQPTMVDVSAKAVTVREARAECLVRLGPELMALLTDGEIRARKGPVFQTAIVAGTMAVKRTADLIPFCHPLAIEGCTLTIVPVDAVSVRIECGVRITGRTGVEMEALTGASVAALTVYDMCKAVSPAIVIDGLRLLEKHGGKRDYLCP